MNATLMMIMVPINAARNRPAHASEGDRHHRRQARRIGTRKRAGAPVPPQNM